MIQEKRAFDATWRELEREGKVDGISGHEYRESLARWQNAGCPITGLRPFITNFTTWAPGKSEPGSSN